MSDANPRHSTGWLDTRRRKRREELSKWEAAKLVPLHGFLKLSGGNSGFPQSPADTGWNSHSSADLPQQRCLTCCVDSSSAMAAQRAPDPRYAGHQGVVGEIFAKHGHSKQPESLQQCAALSAILEVIEMQALKPSPTVLFAAIMASMEKSPTDQTQQVVNADYAMWTALVADCALANALLAEARRTLSVVS